MAGASGGWRRRDVVGAGAGLLTTLAGCVSGDPAPATEGSPSADDPATAASSWRATELTDVATGQPFAIQQFEGRPALLEFFAVWCPVCTSQQRVLGDIVDRPDAPVVISLNTDPNEDADRVREYLERHPAFDWRYAVLPASVTKALVDEFGSVIATPPAAPIVRVCPGGDADLVDGRGVKSADALLAAVEQC